MQKINAKADRQVTSPLDFTAWINVAVIIAIIVLNFMNSKRIADGSGALLSALKPELLMIISFAMILYLSFGCFNALATKRRFSRVFVSLDEAGVSGVSLPHPAANEAGERFSIPFEAIRSVSIEDIAITRKHTAPSLKLETDERAYYVPAPEHLKELVTQIAERMKA